MKDAVQENYESDHDALALNPCKKYQIIYESVHIHSKKSRKMEHTISSWLRPHANRIIFVKA